MSIQDRIIGCIRKNRISTVEVSDCMDKSGVFADANPTQRGAFRVGKVRWVYACDESNWTIHEQIREVREGEVVMIEAFDCGNRALIGALMSKYMLLYMQAAAIISNCPFRDANDIYKERYAVWCNGFTPIGCFNKMPQKMPDHAVIQEHRERYHGAIAVCDDNGVVIIPKELHTEEFLSKLFRIEEQEDIWFDCLDRKKWDTFDIVCKRRYLEEG